MRFQGQRLGFVAGSLSDGKSVILRLPHGDLSKAPRLGDLVLIRDETTNPVSYTHLTLPTTERV